MKTQMEIRVSRFHRRITAGKDGLGRDLYYLQVPGGDYLAWNGKVWREGQITARFSEVADAASFAAGHGFSIIREDYLYTAKATA